VSEAHSPKSAILTIGDLIGELCRWPDHATVTFRYAPEHQHLRFCRIAARSKGTVEIELERALESPPIVPA
jgi:hypothetical protein